MIRGKKAGVQLPLIALFFLIATAVLITNNSITSVENDIGNSQYDILMKIEQATSANVYIDLAAENAASFAKYAVIQSGGVYQPLSPTGTIMSSTCGTHLYPNYNSKTSNCLPTYTASFANYFDDLFFNYLQDYPSERSLYFLYNLNFEQKSPQELVIRAAGESVALPFTGTKRVEDSTTSENTCQNIFLVRKQYPKTALGIYTAEKPITCSSGECFSQVATLLYETYQLQNKNYPYIISGESPYCPQDVRTLAAGDDSFFSNIVISEDRFNQRISTSPGFDSAGWLWWVGKHANITFFNERLSQAQYFQAAQSKQTICKGDACTQTVVLNDAKVGDVFFIRDQEKILEDGSTISAGGIYLALYVAKDNITNRPIIIHATPQKGLVKEYLPEKFISSQHSAIETILRPIYQPNGYTKLPTDLSAIPPFVGPFEWCSAETIDLPSDNYLQQLQQQPYNSPQQDYYTLAIEKGITEGIDPALLITHAVLESSLGQNNKCTSQQKSALTGCGWPESCASGCKCESQWIVSDEAQIACTATTDMAAYKEALSGTHAVVGLYEECSAYQEDPEVFWNCIFCIYQGSYDKVIGSGKRYFLQDKTCEYAERAKGIYCSWRAYFDANWNDLSSLTSLQSTSEITLNPAFSTSTRLDLSAMNLITTDFLPQVYACDNQLKTCVTEVVEQFNNEHDDAVHITLLAKNNVFATSIAEQVLDCRYNEQKGCICPIIPYYNGSGESEKKMVFFSDGRFVAEDDVIYEFDFNPAIPTEQLSLAKSAIILELDGNKAASLYVNDKGEDKILSKKKGWHLITPELPADSVKGEAVLAFGLLKHTYSALSWLPYQQNNTHLTCKANKHYFGFQATIQSTGDVLNFSVYLDDTQPPQDNIVTTTTTSVCFNTPLQNPYFVDAQDFFAGNLNWLSSSQDIVGLTHTATLSWNLINHDEPLHAFIIDVSQDPSFTQLLGTRTVQTATALEQTPINNQALLLEQLIKTPASYGITSYKYRINKPSLAGNTFAENTPYFYRIIPVDEYGNRGKASTTGTFTFTSPKDNSGLPLSSKQFELLKQGTQFSTRNIEDYVCVYNQNVLLGMDHFLPPTSNNLAVYPGLVDPLQPSEPLYHIQGIPNIICDESATTVGKICAGNEQLVTALQQLSSALEANDWTMVISQAHRSWKIQNTLWEQSGFDRSMACDPQTKEQPYLCPHMVGGAIDINILDASKNQISYIEQETFMCGFGFVRYGWEWWHFEMGTKMWEKAMDAQATSSCCYYGRTHADDYRTKTCNI
ncbi:D-alanyl-D-alanine carboxypeptidase family protein [Candidatus Woesearchaeota archaeon]|nr:D-alanyl-D-alanine carboxypeptidase family protein [Candidatus Woesearchaeota archaeon]